MRMTNSYAYECIANSPAINRGQTGERSPGYPDKGHPLSSPQSKLCDSVAGLPDAPCEDATPYRLMRALEADLEAIQIEDTETKQKRRQIMSPIETFWRRGWITGTQFLAGMRFRDAHLSLLLLQLKLLGR